MTQITTRHISQIDKNKINETAKRIIGLAMKVHNQLGPGFVEKIYEKALAYEFKRENIKFKEQADIRVRYEAVELGCQ